MRHPLAETPRHAMWHHMVHYAPDLPLDAPLALEESPAQPTDEQDAARLLAAYHAAADHERGHVPAERRPNSGIWLMVQNEFHGEFQALLAANDPIALAAYLRNGLRHDVAYGVGPGTRMLEAMRGSDRELCGHYVLMITDHLVAAAVALGALPHENPEQGRWGANLALPIPDVVRAIEQAIGVPITRPPIAGLYGLQAGPGQIVDIRVPDDAYCAHRLASLAQTFGYRSICEIGAGFGGTAFQAARHGIDRYTIVDLPVMNVVQGWFLIKALGPERIALFGEPARDDQLQVLPYWEFANQARHVDLVFNRDSIPEMPEARAHEYLAGIEARGCAFLSINQEAEAPADHLGTLQLSVPRLMRSYPRLRSASRHIYWARKGYIEELYLPVRHGA